MNWVFPFLHGGSFEITLTIPLRFEILKIYIQVTEKISWRQPSVPPVLCLIDKLEFTSLFLFKINIKSIWKQWWIKKYSGQNSRIYTRGVTKSVNYQVVLWTSRMLYKYLYIYIWFGLYIYFMLVRRNYLLSACPWPRPEGIGPILHLILNLNPTPGSRQQPYLSYSLYHPLHYLCRVPPLS